MISAPASADETDPRTVIYIPNFDGVLRIDSLRESLDRHPKKISYQGSEPHSNGSPKSDSQYCLRNT